MEINYNIITINEDEQRVDPLAPADEVVWVLNFKGDEPYEAFFSDPRHAIDDLAQIVADCTGTKPDRAKATESVLAHFSTPGCTDSFTLRQVFVDSSRGGGWPARGERVLPTGPGEFSCICDAYVINESFAASDAEGNVVADDVPHGHVVHLGCGRVVDVATALVVHTMDLCIGCGVPIVYVPAHKRWGHITVTPGRETPFCYDDEDSGSVAAPVNKPQRRPNFGRPMPGDAVQLVNAWATAPAGSIGVIDGMVGEITAWSSIAFNVGGMPSVYRDDKVVRCSGGPGTITTDLSELRRTDTTVVLKVWQFRGGRRVRDNREKYEVRVPVWLWDPQQNA